jgi:glycerate kinase
MRVLIAPNPYKGTFSAAEIAGILASKLKRAQPGLHCDLLPLADGGPGTIDALHAALGGRLMRARVRGPLGGELGARWLRVNAGLAVIESAQAIGLERLPASRRDALKASSYGLGQLLLAARSARCREALVGLGGSATTDAGLGMALALGSPAALKGMKIRVLCDVDNPLYGPHGAAYVFAPQKGASGAEVRILDLRLRAAARLMPQDVASMPGAGAAGGLGAALVAFYGATLAPGAATLMRLCKFHSRLKKADWVVSGEGNFDAQSLRGKLPYVVAKEAVKAGKRCTLVCGRVHENIRLKNVELVELRNLS